MSNEVRSPSTQESAGVAEAGMPEGGRMAGTAEGPGPSAAAERPSYEQMLLTVQDAQAKADEHWNQLLLARAELENTRRRAQRDVENAHKYALEKFVGELLPVRDSLEMGLAAANSAEADGQKLREGMDITLRMLTTALEKFGVKEENPLGLKFNPERHQAMALQAASGVEPNTVMAVHQKGYLLNDRLIRAAMEHKGTKIDAKA